MGGINRLIGLASAKAAWLMRTPPSRFFSSWAGSEFNEWTRNASVREPIVIALKLREVSPLPIPGTERWEILQPWQATYWKVLPTGNRLCYRYENWTHGA